MRKRLGFSLIEMVIALAILATATTIAIRATSRLQDQARYQATVNTLNNVQSAIQGPLNQRNPDGTPLVTGFVADVGRLPNYVAGVDPLAELTTNPNNIPFGPVQSNSDNSITIFSGWQGPYIRLPVGTTVIHDGWGNPLHLYDSSKTPIPPSSNAIGVITAWCADNQADPAYGGTGTVTGYNADAAVTIPSSGFGSPSAQLTGFVKMLDSSGNPSAPNTTSAGMTINVTIWICYFGPDGNGGLKEITANPGPATSWQFSISGSFVTLGPRILKAYAIPSTYTTFNSTAVMNAVAVSQPSSIVAVGGGQRVPNLILPNYGP